MATNTEQRGRDTAASHRRPDRSVTSGPAARTTSGSSATTAPSCTAAAEDSHPVRGFAALAQARSRRSRELLSGGGAGAFSFTGSVTALPKQLAEPQTRYETHPRKEKTPAVAGVFGGCEDGDLNPDGC